MLTDVAFPKKVSLSKKVTINFFFVLEGQEVEKNVWRGARAMLKLLIDRRITVKKKKGNIKLGVLTFFNISPVHLHLCQLAALTTLSLCQASDRVIFYFYQH